MNPADLFTNQLTSRDRIAQLIVLFNCEYRDGRSIIAPELRPAAIHAIQTEYDPDANNKSPTHDPDVLPHLYDADDMDKLYESSCST